MVSLRAIWLYRWYAPLYSVGISPCVIALSYHSRCPLQRILLLLLAVFIHIYTGLLVRCDTYLANCKHITSIPAHISVHWLLVMLLVKMANENIIRESVFALPFFYSSLFSRWFLEPANVIRGYGGKGVVPLYEMNFILCLLVDFFFFSLNVFFSIVCSVFMKGARKSVYHAIFLSNSLFLQKLFSICTSGVCGCVFRVATIWPCGRLKFISCGFRQSSDFPLMHMDCYWRTTPIVWRKIEYE